MILRFDPARHIVVDIPFADFIRREFPDHKGLFVYRHRFTGNYMVAKWLDGSRRYAVEYLNLGPSPANITRDTVRELRRRLSTRLTKEELLAATAKSERMLADYVEEINDEYDYNFRSRTKVGWEPALG